jgi:hypothetical protein
MIDDDTDLQGADFPTNVPLPQTMYVDNEEHEQIKEWILTNAMDRDISQVSGNKTNGKYLNMCRTQAIYYFLSYDYWHSSIYLSIYLLSLQYDELVEAYIDTIIVILFSE